MGRGVSYGRGSVWVYYVNPRFSDTEDMTESEMEWDDFMLNLKSVLKVHFPSMSEPSRNEEWLGNEDRVILRNACGMIGVSEYCGIVSVWCVPGPFNPAMSSASAALHRRWCVSIAKSVEAVLGGEFPGDVYLKVGCMSNGEGVYRPIR